MDYSSFLVLQFDLLKWIILFLGIVLVIVLTHDRFLLSIFQPNIAEYFISSACSIGCAADSKDSGSFPFDRLQNRRQRIILFTFEKVNNLLAK